jgi:hypothetical protein
MNTLANQLSRFPGMASLDIGGWFTKLGEIAGGLFSVVKDAGSRVAAEALKMGGKFAAGATKVVCSAGAFIAAHPIGVGVATAAAVLGGAIYYGYKYIGGLGAKIANQQRDMNLANDLAVENHGDVENLMNNLRRALGLVQTGTGTFQERGEAIIREINALKKEREEALRQCNYAQKEPTKVLQ